jgi:hypothetical protein
MSRLLLASSLQATRLILVAKSIFTRRMNIVKMKKSTVFDFATRI